MYLGEDNGGDPFLRSEIRYDDEVVVITVKTVTTLIPLFSVVYCM